MSDPSIVVREYNPLNGGGFVSNISSLSFGNVPVGMHTPVKMLDVAFVGVSAVSNVKIGLISSGGLKVTDENEDAEEGQSVQNGYFGIEQSPQPIQVNRCSRHFRNIYDSLSSPTNAVSIGLRDENMLITNYIYIDIQLQNSDVGPKGGAYRIFFDYTV